MYAFRDFLNERLWRSYGLRVLILGLGIFLRVYQFPYNPPGFYVDEAGIGYEAFCLLNTGADRWGIHLPVYFISWGSGQSVLYAYLSIPFIATFGLNVFATRLSSLFVGILSIPLVYVTVRRIVGKEAALIAMLAFAILPWHIMISRWALDANLFPFFLLLGTYTVARMLGQKVPRWGCLALVPWGLALYAYGIGLLVVPVLLILVIISTLQAINLHRRAWLGALMIFILLALPITLFAVKNFVTHTDLPFENLLPFGVPLVPFSRIAQVSSQPVDERLINSFLIALMGFQDNEIKNSLPGIAPMFWVCLPLALVGGFVKIRESHQTGRVDLFLLWLVTCIPLLFLWDMAVNRVNAIFIPLLVVAVEGMLYLARVLVGTSRAIFLLGVGFLVMLQASVFVTDYFGVYPRMPDTELAFYKGFERALHRGIATAAPTEAILVTNRILLPYFLVAFYSRYPPLEYQRDLRYTLDYGTVNVQSLGRYYFDVEHLPKDQPTFVYVLAKWDEVPCPDPRMLLETRLWQVGRCVHQ
jgi:hypothetical protein